MHSFFHYATQPATVAMSLRVALVVGTVLAIINHYDMFWEGVYPPRRILQVAITYLVPYGVATYGAVREAARRERPAQMP